MPTYTSQSTGGDVLLANPMPQAEYMYGCTPTAMAMLLGYHDLYGYRGADVSNIIEGTVAVKSRATDGNAYDMDAFDTVLGRAIASEEYVYRFHSRDGVETTPEEELVYAFKSDNKTLNTDVWNCLADYLGTGQYWRGRENLSTTEAYGSLESIYSKSYRDVTITDGTNTRTVSYLDTIMLHGLDLYVKSRGYALDYEITGTYRVDVNGGTFTFEDYKNEIDSGRPVLITITGHSMVGYGYNADTQEIIFDDCYQAGQRMKWGGTYRYSDEDRKLQSITVVGFNMNGDVDISLTNVGTTSRKLILSGTSGELPDTDYCIAGPGGTVYLTYVAANLGSKKSGDFSATIRIDGKFYSSTELKSISANGTRKVANVSLGKLSVGIHNVRVILDESNEIQETNGANNSAGRDVLILKSGTSIATNYRTVNTGETVSDFCMMRGGTLFLNGGSAYDTVLLGKANVSQGAVMSGTIICSGGNLQVYNGGTVSETRIDSAGAATVYNLGSVSKTTVESGGRFIVQSGGVTAETTIGSGGRMYVSSGGTATGRLNLKNGASATFNDGSVLNFDLSCLTPGGSACVNDLSRITGGQPVYTLTLSGTQAKGSYKLAGGAAGFNKTISVRDENGVKLGSLKVKGTLATGNAAYKLKLNEEVLSLTVMENGLPTVSKVRANITTLTCLDVTVTAVFADDVALDKSLYRIGETGKWMAYEKGGVTVSENTTVYFKAVDTGGNESEIEAIEVKNIDKSAPDDKKNNWVYDKKQTTSLNPQVAESIPLEITAETTDILLDRDQLCFGVWHNYVGVDDEADYLKIHLADASKLSFRINATDAAKLVIYRLVTGTDKKGNTTYTMKAFQTTSFKKPKNADEYSSASKPFLLEEGDYYISVQSTNAKKGGCTFYNMAVDTAKFFYDADDGANDFLYDKKTKKQNESLVSSDPAVITSDTKTILLDTDPTASAGRDNYVGFGDESDFVKIRLDSAASMSFLVNADDAAKFAIYSLTEGTDKSGNTTYTMKALQTTTLKKQKKAAEYTAETKSILLEKGEYYLSMQSTNAAKGGEAYYDVRLGNAVFFTDGDDGWNNWLYDKKTKSLNPGADSFLVTEISSDTAGIRLDYAPTGLDGWDNFVGFGDDTDYARIRLSGDAKLCFTIESTDAAKFVIWSLATGTDKKGNTTYTLKQIQSTSLKKAKGADVYAADTKAVFLTGGEYYISMQSTNAKKGGTAYYNVTLNKDACEGLLPVSGLQSAASAQDAFAAASGSLPGNSDGLASLPASSLLA